VSTISQTFERVVTTLDQDSVRGLATILQLSEIVVADSEKRLKAW
jgi:hypothetical protein